MRSSLFNHPKAGVPYLALPIVTLGLIFSSGDTVNVLGILTGVYLSWILIIFIGIGISFTLGYFDTVDGKSMFTVALIYVLGFSIGFAANFFLFNRLDFLSINSILLFFLSFLAHAPGYLFLKFIK